MVPGPPVRKAPNVLPEIDPPALLVTLPPPSMSTPAAFVAVIVPELTRVAVPPWLETPATPPRMDAPELLVTLPPEFRAMP